MAEAVAVVLAAVGVGGVVADVEFVVVDDDAAAASIGAADGS